MDVYLVAVIAYLLTLTGITVWLGFRVKTQEHFMEERYGTPARVLATIATVVTIHSALAASTVALILVSLATPPQPERSGRFAAQPGG